MKRLVFALLLAIPVHSADWPQWRGQGRDGFSSETGLLAKWPAGGPPLVWKITGLGEGFSGVSIAQGSIITQGQRAGHEFVAAFDVATGKKLWETATGEPYEEERGNGPRGTPTVDGDQVFAEAADGTLVSLDVKSGKKLWSVDFVKDFGGQIPGWGYSESPLVEGENVIVTPGGTRATVAALDRSTGKPVWMLKQGEGAGYSSPIVGQVLDVRIFVVFTQSSVLGIRTANGDLLWRYDKVSNDTANIATPIYRDPYVFVSSDYGTGCALLKLTNTANKVSASEVYFSREMRNHYSTSVVAGGTVYGFSGDILTAMNLATGKVEWRDRSVGKGSVTLADGKLYLLSEDGVVGLAEATPTGYKEISRFSIPAGQFNTWAPIAISNGRMYLREQDNLYSYGIK